MACEIDIGASGDLPEAGESWLGEEAGAVFDGVHDDFAGDAGARADDGHVSAEHIPELGELVYGVFADEASDACDAGVALHLEGNGVASVFVLFEELVFYLVGVDDHGAEFPHLEAGAAVADAFLVEEDGSAIFDFDQKGGDGVDGRKGKQGAGGRHDIDNAFQSEGESKHESPCGSFGFYAKVEFGFSDRGACLRPVVDDFLVLKMWVGLHFWLFDSVNRPEMRGQKRYLAMSPISMRRFPSGAVRIW